MSPPVQPSVRLAARMLVLTRCLMLATPIGFGLVIARIMALARQDPGTTGKPRSRQQS